jgi:hypothetical protein
MIYNALKRRTTCISEELFYKSSFNKRHSFKRGTSKKEVEVITGMYAFCASAIERNAYISPTASITNIVFIVQLGSYTSTAIIQIVYYQCSIINKRASQLSSD